MGRSGGRSGGGRSSGGRSSGSRSSGGRSSSSGRSSRSSLGSGSSLSRSGSSFGRNSVQRGNVLNSSYNYSPRVGHHRRHTVSNRKLGCMPVAICSIITFAFFVIVISVLIADSNEVTRSTVKRVKLSSGLAQDVGWYVDELGWVKSSTNMTSGLRHFYNKTGVKPFLFLTDSINGQSPKATSMQAEELMEQYSQSMYDHLFRDEAHILVIFYEYDGEYLMWHVTGKMAQTVMDVEALDILLDCIEHWYYRDVNEDTMFSNAFRDAGDRIMQVYRSPIVYLVLAFLGVIALLIAFMWWRKRAAHKLAELKETNEILRTPLDTTLSGDAADLAKKYEGVDS